MFLEHNTNKRIRTSKAYSSTHDIRSRWPKKNIANVTAKALSNTCADDKFTELILAAPSVDITNIDTAKVSTEENIKDFKQQMVTSCHNMFAVANEAIADHPELKRVILMEHAPRFDKKAIDPTGLKPKLALYANTIFAQMWQNSGTKERIIIGKHTLECVGDQMLGRYSGTRMRSQGGLMESICMVAMARELLPGVSVKLLPPWVQWVKTTIPPALKHNIKTETKLAPTSILFLSATCSMFWETK